MEDNFAMNKSLSDYLMENIQTVMESDVEEKMTQFPYTRMTSEFFQKLKFIYDIDFDKKLISEDLLDKMMNEVERSLPR